MKKLLPLALIGGGIALAAGGKKKKKKKKKSAFDDLPPVDDADGGFQDGDADNSNFPPDPKDTGSKIPPGDPPNPAGAGEWGNYDHGYWELGNQQDTRANILRHFADFGYATPTTRNTMNDPGKDGVLGGNDDLPNEEVRRFQKEYNAVSRSRTLAGPEMGGLFPDGFVGPKTLNGLKFVKDNLGARAWSDAVKEAGNKGYKP